jgi:hypothetical protein
MKLPDVPIAHEDFFAPCFFTVGDLDEWYESIRLSNRFVFALLPMLL